MVYVAAPVELTLNVPCVLPAAAKVFAATKASSKLSTPLCAIQPLNIVVLLLLLIVERLELTRLIAIRARNA
jgi:hypothetical protein